MDDVKNTEIKIYMVDFLYTSGDVLRKKRVAYITLRCGMRCLEMLATRVNLTCNGALEEAQELA